MQRAAAVQMCLFNARNFAFSNVIELESTVLEKAPNEIEAHLQQKVQQPC